MNALVRKVTTGLEALVSVALVSSYSNVISSHSFVIDVNECGFDNGNCSHTCINMGGTYRCECPVGYVLQPNKLDCVG